MSDSDEIVYCFKIKKFLEIDFYLIDKNLFYIIKNSI